MELKQGQAVAKEIIGRLQPYCKRVEVAGSIRRLKSQVKDVEVVFITEIGMERVGLWNDIEIETALVNCGIASMVFEGILSWDEIVKRQGPKYKRLIHNETSIVVEIFGACESNWGLIYALRTGPCDFNQKIVTKRMHGGAMPTGMKIQGGYLWSHDMRLPTPTELDYFNELGLPYWAPEKRSVGGLTEYLRRSSVA